MKRKLVGIILIVGLFFVSGVAMAERSGNIGYKLSVLGDAYALICETEFKFVNRNGETVTHKAKNYTQVNWIEKDHEDILQESANLIENNWACVVDEAMIGIPVENDYVIKYIN